MKLNWGTGLAAFIILFLVVMISIVLWTTTHDVNLVADNYYEKEIKYQQQIDKIKRTEALPEQIQISLQESAILIQFPKLFNYSDIAGEVRLYRPSDQKSDLSYPIQIDSSYAILMSSQNLQAGVWKIQVDWNVKNEEFYNEKILMIK